MKIIDIHSKGQYPANVLSNFYPNSFIYDGVFIRSMEGFLQSLRYQHPLIQKEICSLTGLEAKKRSIKTKNYLYWQGEQYMRESDGYQNLLFSAYSEMFNQSQTFKNALLSTKGYELIHSIGSNDLYSVLTETEFCSILTTIRDNNG